MSKPTLNEIRAVLETWGRLKKERELVGLLAVETIKRAGWNVADQEMAIHVMNKMVAEAFLAGELVENPVRQ